MAPKIKGKAMLPPSLASSGFKVRSLVTDLNNISSNIPTNTPELPKPSPDGFLLSEQALYLDNLFKLSPYYLTPTNTKQNEPVVDRYSDRYRTVNNEVKLSSLGLDTNDFPEELHSVIIPNYSSIKKRVKEGMSFGDALAKLSTSKEEENTEEKEDVDEEIKEDEEEPFEEEDEEDNDYCQSYFDAGDDYVDYDGGGGEDGPEF
jgi:hypothetical protein